MHETNQPGDGLPQRDLAVILEAWQCATERLEQTHAALRAEVQRLTDELEQKNRELARKNRLADLGQMAAHIAHEVRNTLVPVSLYLSLLQRKLAADRSSREVLDKIHSGFTALEVTVADLLHFTADREARTELTAPADVVTRAVEALTPQLQAQRVRVSCDLDRTVAVRVDGEMLRRAIVNLVLNALDVLPNGGAITITGVHASQGYDLEIADNGPGWSDAALERATEPFFTTKSHGTGLGLAIVERIMDAHDGRIELRNCPEGGACATLRFPTVAVEQIVEEPRIKRFPSVETNEPSILRRAA